MMYDEIKNYTITIAGSCGVTQQRKWVALGFLALASLTPNRAFAQAGTLASCETVGNPSHLIGLSVVTCTPPDQNQSGFTRSETASARAAFGTLGVSGSGTLTVSDNSNGAVTEFEDETSFQDPFTITASTPLTGFLAVSDLVSGSQGVTSSGVINSSFSTTLDIGNTVGNTTSIMLGNGTSSYTVGLAFTAGEFVPNGSDYVYSSTLLVQLNSLGLCEVTTGAMCNVFASYFDTSRVRP